MINQFSSVPNLDKYANGAVGEKFLLDVWQDTVFGGDIFSPTKTYDEKQNYMKVPNNFETLMTDVTVNSKQFHGYFKIHNVHISEGYFVDIWL